MQSFLKVFSKGFFISAGVGTSSNPCSDTYPGGSPFSEIEVKNVATYLKGIQQRLKGFWTIHAYSQLVLTPWGYKRDLPYDYTEIVSSMSNFIY